MSKSKINEGFMDWATEGVQLANAAKDFVKASGGGYSVSVPEIFAVISEISSEEVEKAMEEGGPSAVVQLAVDKMENYGKYEGAHDWGLSLFGLPSDKALEMVGLEGIVPGAEEEEVDVDVDVEDQADPEYPVSDSTDITESSAPVLGRYVIRSIMSEEVENLREDS